MTNEIRRFTLEDFLAIPEQQPALEYHADGSTSQKAAGDTNHAALQAHLAHLLLNYADAVSPRRGYVYTELRTNIGGASRLPDVAFYRQQPPESGRKHALAPADVAVEILSPGDVLEDQRAKCRWYVSLGAACALLVDPLTRTVEVFEQAGSRSASGSESLLPPTIAPGLALSPNAIFAVLD